MRTAISATTIVAAALAAASSATAQVHTRTPLIQAQPASFDFTGLPPNEFGVLLLSPAGAGNGLCFPPPLNTCLGILQPLIVGPQLSSDAQGSASFGLTIAPDSQLFRIASQGLWFDFRGPNPQIAATNAVDGSIETLAAYNESFDGDGIDPAWQVRNGAAFSFGIGPNAELEFRPILSGPGNRWADDDEGGFLWREIYGDFVIETSVQSYDSNQPANPPAEPRRFGGLLLRDPNSAPGARNWAAIGIGGGDAATPHAITAITTVGSVSTFALVDQSTAFSALETQLRLVRIGDQIRCEYNNNPVIPPLILATANLPGLPNPVEVGMFVSSEPSPPDMVTAFRYIRYEGQ